MDERALGNKFAAECARALPQSARVACDASAHQQPAGCMGGRSGDMHADGSHAPSWPEAMPGRGVDDALIAPLDELVQIAEIRPDEMSKLILILIR